MTKKEWQPKTKIRISVLVGFLSLFASILVTFFFNRFLLNSPQIGDTNYGLKATAESFISFVTVFLSGMSTTFIRFHRKYEKEENNFFASLNVMGLVLAAAALIFGTVVVVLACNGCIIHASDGGYTQKQVYDFTIILVVSFIYVIATIVLSSNRWFLESVRSIIFVRIIELLCIVVYPLIAVLFVSLGADIVGVTIIYSAVYLGGLIACFIYRLIKSKHQNPFVLKGAKKEIIRDIFSFSFFVVLASFIEIFNQSFDTIFLTSAVAASSTALYQLTLSIHQVLLTSTESICGPYIPYISDDVKNNNQQGIVEKYNRVSLLLLLLSSTIFMGFFACGKEFISLWLGDNRILVYYFGLAVLAAWPLYCMSRVGIVFQRCCNKHQKRIFVDIIVLAVHIAVTCLLTLVFNMGAWGSIIGLASSMALYGILVILYNKKYLHFSIKPYLFNFIKCAVAIGVSLTISWLVNTYLNFGADVAPILVLLFKGLLAVVIWAVLIFALFYKECSHALNRFFNSTYDADGNCVHVATFDKLRKYLFSKKNTINKLFPYIFIAYFLTNFASYWMGGITPIASFVAGDLFKYGTKLISYLILLPYCFVFAVANNTRPRKSFVALLFILVISGIISLIILPKTMTIYAVNSYDNIVKTVYKVGFVPLIVDCLNFVIDLIVFAFYLECVHKRISLNALTPFVVFIVGFTVAECIFSIGTEFREYLSIFNKTETSFSGYDTNISATFSSKNGFGLLLFQGFLGCMFLLRHKKSWYIFVVLFLILAVTLFSLCKTSLIAMLVALAVYYVYMLIKQYKKKRKYFYINVSVLGVIVLLVVLALCDVFSGIPFIATVVSKIKSVFFVSSDATTRSRIMIWSESFKLIQGPYAIVGYGKTPSVDVLMAASSQTASSYHNAILDLVVSRGVIGLAAYAYTFYFLIKEKFLKKKDMLSFIFFIAVLISSFSYGMMEAAVLFMSSSCAMLTSNLLLAASNDDVEMVEEHYYEVKI